MTQKLELYQLAGKYAGELRKRATLAEQELCRLLDKNKISYVFQSHISDKKSKRIYIPDFRIRLINRHPKPKGMSRKKWRCEEIKKGTYIPHHKLKLFVEVDGSSHDNKTVYDNKRTEWIETTRGAKVIRFTNNDVFSRPNDIIAEIESYNPVHKTSKISSTSYFKLLLCSCIYNLTCLNYTIKTKK